MSRAEADDLQGRCRLAESKLTDAEELAEGLFQSQVDELMLAAFDSEGIFGSVLNVNDTMCQRLGYKKDQFLALNPAKLRTMVLPGDCDSIRSALAEKQYALFESELKTTGGDVLFRDVVLRTFSLKGNQVVLMIARDISRRKKLESDLEQSAKMDAMGRLAGGMAHDMNNILTVINGETEFALEEAIKEPKVEESLKAVQAATRRAMKLTQQLLIFSRRQEVKVKPIDLNKVTNDVSGMLKRLIAEHIDVQVELSAKSCGLLIDKGQLEQVILNLSVNARDAMPSGGKLEIRTFRDRRRNPFPSEDNTHEPAPTVCLAVSDNGKGMDAKTLEQAFEPFFSTKEAGKGTGLGLSVVFGIVEKAGGWITVDSAPGKGTSVTCHFPEVDLPPGEVAVPAGASAEATAGGASTSEKRLILLVEDDQSLRKIVNRMLRSLGYEVVEAGDAAEGYKLYQEHVNELAMMISDIVMPGESGHDLARRVRAESETLPILLCSGYTDLGLNVREMRQMGLRFLHKPFSREQLEVALKG